MPWLESVGLLGSIPSAYCYVHIVQWHTKGGVCGRRWCLWGGTSVAVAFLLIKVKIINKKLNSE